MGVTLLDIVGGLRVSLKLRRGLKFLSIRSTDKITSSLPIPQYLIYPSLLLFSSDTVLVL